MPTSLPFVGSGAKNAVPIQSPAPLALEIAVTPSPDGSYHVSWSIAVAPVDGVSTTYSQLAGGSLQMFPTDPVAKLLYAVRGGLLQALQGLTMQQIIPLASTLPAGSSFLWSVQPDMIAALPSNPANAGL